MKIPFFKPLIEEEEINSVTNCLNSGWLTTGNRCKEFEKNFATYLKTSNYTITVNSNTSGLHLALEAIGIKAGDEVITTTLTFTATAEVIRYLGAIPRFVDISKDSYCIDPEKIEKAITPRTKCIIPVHFAGFPIDMKTINDIASKYSIDVVEDCAHALPSKYSNGDFVGDSRSNTCVFSFYANKCITTGEGGMIVTPNKKIYDRIKIMRLHGIDRDALDRFTNIKSSWFYDVVEAGYKYNMPDINAALGIEQLKKSSIFHSKRKKIAEKYISELSNLKIKLPSHPENKDDHAWHIFAIKLNKNNSERDDFNRYLNDKGIGTSVHYRPLHMNTYWKKVIKNSGYNSNFPISEEYFENCLSIPIYPCLTDKETDYIITNIKKFLL